MKIKYHELMCQDCLNKIQLHQLEKRRKRNRRWMKVKRANDKSWAIQRDKRSNFNRILRKVLE